MDYRFLGRAGVKVSSLCLGTMNFGRSNCDESLSRKIMEHAVENGVNFFDTADGYSKHQSEEIIGRWLSDGGSSRRNSLVVATKVCSKVGPAVNDRGLSRFHIFQAVEDSLKRLRTDRIDLYQCHAQDQTPIEETIRAMDDLVRAGKVLYWGTSNFQVWQILEALYKSDQMNAVGPVTEQCGYRMTHRHPEDQLAPFCMKYGVRMLAYSPLDGGLLSGCFRKDQPIVESPRNAGEKWRKNLENNLETIESLARIADELGRPLTHLAYAFLYRQPHLASVVGGPSKVEHLEAALAAMDLILSPEVLARIDACVAPGAGPIYKR